MEIFICNVVCYCGYVNFNVYFPVEMGELKCGLGVCDVCAFFSFILRLC